MFTRDLLFDIVDNGRGSIRVSPKAFSWKNRGICPFSDITATTRHRRPFVRFYILYG